MEMFDMAGTKASGGKSGATGKAAKRAPAKKATRKAK
jgi:hypothetical protein